MKSIGLKTSMIHLENDHSNVELPEAHIIIDAVPNSGLYNMSMDAALLQFAANREFSVVRIYEWSEPTVTVGYFQGAGNPQETPFANLPLVRRLSGGGAILHHHEITYSLVLPATHPTRQDPSAVYSLVHIAIIDLLRKCNVDSQLRSDYDARSPQPSDTKETVVSEPFLCFLRKNPNDIVHQSGIKIVGSAQRRRKGVTLQHGSIVLKRSVFAPEIPGVFDLDSNFCEARFRQELPGSIGKALGGRVSFRSVFAEEEQLAHALATEFVGSTKETKTNLGRNA